MLRPYASQAGTLRIPSCDPMHPRLGPTHPRLRPYASQAGAAFELVLNFPRDVPTPCRHLIARLLVRDPKQRLGARQQDARLLRGHSFFDTVDWSSLLAKQVRPLPTALGVRTYSHLLVDATGLEHLLGKEPAAPLRPLRS